MHAIRYAPALRGRPCSVCAARTYGHDKVSQPRTCRPSPTASATYGEPRGTDIPGSDARTEKPILRRSAATEGDRRYAGVVVIVSSV